MESLKKLGIIAIIAIVIFGIIGISLNSSKANPTSEARDNTSQTVYNVDNVDVYLNDECFNYSGECIMVIDSVYSDRFVTPSGYVPHGSGLLKFKDGRYYKGHFSYGEMDGPNAYFSYPNGDVFVGSFKNGQPSKGTWYDKHGNVLDTI